jgi:hypothetical protein
MQHRHKNCCKIWKYCENLQTSILLFDWALDENKVLVSHIGMHFVMYPQFIYLKQRVLHKMPYPCVVYLYFYYLLNHLKYIFLSIFIFVIVIVFGMCYMRFQRERKHWQWVCTKKWTSLFRSTKCHNKNYIYCSIIFNINCSIIYH